NISAASSALTVTVDVTPGAAPSTPDLQAASDSGVSSTDNITNAANPVFTGSGAEAGATVRLYAGAALAGSAVADAGGNWSITSTVAEGKEIAFTTEQVDAAGNVSARSEALAVTVDRTAPSAPAALDLIAASDSGDVNTDNLTRVTTPTITGTAEANSLVTLYDGETVVGTATANGSGVWSITTSTLDNGEHNLTAKATDAAGNISAASSALTVTVDVTPGAAPSTPDLQAASDSGVSSTDNITNAANPVFTGSGAEAGATVRLYAGAALAGSAVADASGNWSITSTVAEGKEIAFTTEQVDAAGNVSARSEALAVTVDRTAPSAPAALDLTAASDSGDVNTDNLTRVTTPTITG
ncbi:Ig-like domain-containing protein, partial [Pseudoduganella ginsengisoli]